MVYFRLTKNLKFYTSSELLKGSNDVSSPTDDRLSDRLLLNDEDLEYSRFLSTLNYFFNLYLHLLFEELNC